VEDGRLDDEAIHAPCVARHRGRIELERRTLRESVESLSHPFVPNAHQFVNRSNEENP
jgi:hypothetical protein